MIEPVGRNYPFGSESGKKRKECGTAVLLVAFGALLTAAAHAARPAGMKPDGAKKVVDQLQGKWTMVLMHDRGRKIELKPDRGVDFAIKENKWIRWDGKEVGEFQIDASSTPATIDLKVTGEGEEKGRTLEGIVEVEGDTMRWCFYERVGAKQRPTSFPKDPDPDIVLYGCKRFKE
jgi:uncharacterized protein (TIGR03067 family)